jgi:hypothetical protein
MLDEENLGVFGLLTQSRKLFTLDYGCEHGELSLPIQFVTILDPISVFHSAVHFWVELKA